MLVRTTDGYFLQRNATLAVSAASHRTRTEPHWKYLLDAIQVVSG
jgi:hypothetical protein